MKCPKCNFASFEYLNTCKKCGNDLTLHKTELGIDFPQYNSLGLMAMLRHEASPQAAVAEPAAVVQDERSANPFSDTSGTEKLSGVSDFNSVMESDTDFSNIGSDIDLGGESFDLGELGGSADETASIKTPSVEDEAISLDEPDTASPAIQKEAAAGDLGGIDFDMGTLDEAAAPSKASKEEEFSLDLGDIEISAESPKPAETKKAAPAPAPAADSSADFNMEGLDFDINLDDIDASVTENKNEPKKDEKKKDDFDIDIDLSDLKLD